MFGIRSVIKWKNDFSHSTTCISTSWWSYFPFFHPFLLLLSCQTGLNFEYSLAGKLYAMPQQKLLILNYFTAGLTELFLACLGSPGFFSNHLHFEVISSSSSNSTCNITTFNWQHRTKIRWLGLSTACSLHFGTTIINIFGSYFNVWYIGWPCDFKKLFRATRFNHKGQLQAYVTQFLKVVRLPIKKDCGSHRNIS